MHASIGLFLRREERLWSLYLSKHALLDSLFLLCLIRESRMQQSPQASQSLVEIEALSKFLRVALR